MAEDRIPDGTPDGILALSEEPPSGPDARRCLDRYFRELAERFEGGFDHADGSVAGDDEMAPPRGVFIVARLGDRPVGCGGLRTLDRTTGEIKRMWTAPPARGRGVARALLHGLERRGREIGFERIRLDTNRVLKEAQLFYRREGYVEVERYGDNPYADHWFEKTL